MVDASFPSNSQSARPSQSEPASDRPKIESVVTGEVGKRKTPLGKRFAETFLGGDARSTANYVVLDVLVPAFKDMMSDAVSQAIDRMLFGERAGGRRGGSRPSGASGYVNYNRMGRSGGNRDRVEREDPRMSPRARTTHNFDEIILATRIEAETVLNRLEDLIRDYETATVSDLYSLVGISPSFTDGKWGWDELPGARVVRDGGGYLLDLPRPKAVE